MSRSHLRLTVAAYRSVLRNLRDRMLSIFLRSLDQSDRIAEARMLGAFKPFEHDHLGHNDLGAVPLHAANCDLLALRMTRAECVPYDANLRPASSKPRTVCSTHTWASQPATTMCRSAGMALRKSSSRIASNVSPTTARIA